MRSIRKRHGNIETAVVRFTSPVRKPITVIGMQHIADAEFYDTVAEEIKALQPRKAAEQAVILDMRNSVAVNAALKAAEDRPVVMPWGAGHIPGLTKKLGEYHYRVAEVRWLTALRRPA